MKYRSIAAFVMLLAGCSNGVRDPGPDLGSLPRSPSHSGGSAEEAASSLHRETVRLHSLREQSVRSTAPRDAFFDRVHAFGCSAVFVSPHREIIRIQCVGTQHFRLREFRLSDEAVELWQSVGAQIASERNVRVAVIGHADHTPVATPVETRTCSNWNPDSTQRLAQQLQARTQADWPLGQPASVQANQQLSWCRAAALVQAILAGARNTAPTSSSEMTGNGRSVAIVGVGDSWTRSAAGRAHCPQNNGAFCDAARRIDVFLQFADAPRAVGSQCHDIPSPSTLAERLWCWQHVHQSRAVSARPVLPEQGAVRQLLVGERASSEYEFVLTSDGTPHRVADRVIELAGSRSQ